MLLAAFIWFLSRTDQCSSNLQTGASLEKRNSYYKNETRTTKTRKIEFRTSGENLQLVFCLLSFHVRKQTMFTSNLYELYNE